MDCIILQSDNKCELILQLTSVHQRKMVIAMDKHTIMGGTVSAAGFYLVEVDSLLSVRDQMNRPG